MGDAVQAGRLECLDDFWTGFNWSDDLGRFNLLGDPALDIGDRMKYRGIYCDLVVSPEDLESCAYPTIPAGSSTGTMSFSVTVRNIGYYSSSACEAELEVDWDSNLSVLEASCPALDPGESTTLSFEWTIPSGIEIKDEIELTAEIDTEDACTESWEYNNEASVTVMYIGGFPNDDGWPVRLAGSVFSPPVLADLDGDGDMEIIAISGWMISAVSSDDQSVIWDAGPYHFRRNEESNGYSIAAVGDVSGDSDPEVIFDTMYELVVLNGETGEEIDTFEHGKFEMYYGPHGVTLADIFADSGKLEIAVVCPEEDNDPLSLFILNVQSNSITELDQEYLPSSANNFEREWTCAYDLTADDSAELVLSYSRKGSTAYESGIGIYDHVEGTSTSQFTDYITWSDGSTWKAGIQAIGRLTGSTDQIAVSRRKSESGVHIPASIYDADDLSGTPDYCEAFTAHSDWILCCIMADWSNLDTGLDRVIAPAENQCMVWDDNGDLLSAWNYEYGISSVDAYPPFPALANLVADTPYEYPELIVGTRTGWIDALDLSNSSIEDLGFPYLLPAEISCGFVVADIDLDEKLEVVFGTIDNFLHVWELDDCDEGYAPWPQCQRDAARTGTLTEE
jgi:hypothetical protein